ncbi:Metallo-dependent phosphatase-like protein [Glomus cerebriforme]|uniref:Metallo-dependent phosphatase-like protein n=1 Tax=Glomus cerebriforme TaxID=658196 RepID=A0A397SKI4_9GLOM|nr:Metallo-dependent phosphatase-like protein [Glomus cerebriforme]
MDSIINILILFIVIMNWNIKANPINTRWNMHDYQLLQQKPFQIIANDDKELSGKFLHITDIHLDSLYIPNSDPSKFCRRYAKKSKKNKSGKFGTIKSDCDSPYELTNSTFLFLREKFQDVDFVIYTGDSLRHDRDPKISLTEDYVKWGHKLIVKYIMETFDIDKTKFIPTLGNNDEWVHNQLEDGPNTLLSNLTQIWAPLKLNLTSDFIKGGYFRQDINSKLSVFSLNSMYFSNSNDQIKDCNHENSPGAIQLKWIRYQLENARKEKRKVFIAQHIPPLNSDGESFYHVCYVKYVQLLGRYSDIISGHFTGHTNLDSLTFVTESGNIADYRLLYLDKDEHPSIKSNQNIVLVLNNAPSIIPVNNPGIREYRYSTSFKTFGILTDYIQYYSDIKKANKIGKIEWEIEYIASKTYGIKELSPSGWAKVLDQMKDKGSKLWRVYLKYFTVSTN